MKCTNIGLLDLDNLLKNSVRYLYYSFALLAILAVIASIQNLMQPETFWFGNAKPYTAYNNFIIFRQSFFHLINDQNLYIAYKEEYADLFKYSPAFALLMAPFCLIPISAGLVLWNLTGALLFYAGIKKLQISPAQLFVLSIALAPELHTSFLNSQSNIHIAGLSLLAWNYLEKEKFSQAAFCVMLTAFIKLFTLVLLPLWLMYKHKDKQLLFGLIWLLVFAFAPALITGWNSLMTQYSNWAEMLRHDHSTSSGLGLYGLLQALSDSKMNRDFVMAFGLVLLVLPLVKLKQFKDFTFRRLYLAFLLLWMVLFNHKAESPTYIIALTGIALFVVTENFSWFALTLGVCSLLFTSLSVSDLVPYEIRKTVVEAYCVKAIVPTLVSIVLSIRLLCYNGLRPIKQDSHSHSARL